MNGNARDKILKSWAGISEVALIKEVATKGPPLVELCIEYWARKRKMSIEEYQMFFHEVVKTYVQRLLTERLVCKAEMVLRNVQRDVRTFYYEFACESNDVELRETIMDYLKKKETTEDDFRELRFNWELLQMLKANPDLLAKIKTKLPHRHINIEAMELLETNFRKRIIVELYFQTDNTELLPHLSKRATWDYLVETQSQKKLLRWFNCCDSDNAFDQMIASWLPIDQEMYEYALKTLRDPEDALRDCFASAGHFFPDERSNVIIVLQRICSTRSFDVNRDLLKNLPMARFLFERKEFMLLLCPFVAVRELKELSNEFPDQRHLIELLIALRSNEIETRSGFEKISFATKIYLEHESQSSSDNSNNPYTNVDEPLVTFYEFLCYKPTIIALSCSIRSGTMQRIPYLQALSTRLTANQNEAHDEIPKSTCPTAYELLRKFRKLDFAEINRELAPDEIVSFSNDRLCQRYARRYQLNFLHYLKQHRSSYAVYYLLTAHLQSYAQLTRPQLFSACETVTEIAIEHSENAELVAHCVAFAEMLGFDTQLLRTLLKLRALLEASSIQTSTINYTSLIGHIEALILPKLIFADEETTNSKIFPLAEYQALMRLVNCKMQRCWPNLILQHYASKNDWWRLLVLLQFFELPLSEIRNLIVSFETPQIGEHLLRALSYEVPSPGGCFERQNSGTGGKHRHNNANSKQRKMQSSENGQPLTTSIETMTSSLSSCNDTSNNSIALTPKSIDQAQQMRFLATLDQAMSTADPAAASKIDLFALMILSATNMAEERITCLSKFLDLMQDNQHVQHATSWNLLRSCVKYRLPVLAVVAATVNVENIDWHFMVWLAVATSQWSELLHKAVQINDKFNELSWHLMQRAVQQGYVITVCRGICIFYGQDHPLAHLFYFLQLTQHQRDFTERAVHELSLYFLAWSNDEVSFPLDSMTVVEQDSSAHRDKILQRSMQLFLVHLQYNFDSILEQQKFLSCVCRSGLTDLCGGQIDFCLLNEVFGILQSTVNVAGNDEKNFLQQQNYVINFESLLQEHKGSHEEYKRLLNALLESQNYDAALRLATLLHLPICDIVYAKWIASLNTNAETNESEADASAVFNSYEAEIVEHSLPPEILVNFFLYAASRLDETTGARRKYLLLQHALNVIKKHLLFPSESFDRDQIEYTMILCYLQLDETATADLAIYHSEYYEQIMLKERCVLYKSFLELKELACIEDLNAISLRVPLNETMQQRLECLLLRLLDEGDIVEALRLQELFECRPLDLRFIVFCMALAEGVTTIFSMSSEERQLLRDVEKSAFAKFNKRTLDTLRSSGSQHNQQAFSSSPMRDEFSDSCSTLEFEEIPSKEKRETLETIQGIASKLKHGIDLGKRIVMAYRAAMYLDKEYLDVLRTKDANILLRSVAEEGCMHRLLVVSDIMTSTHMTATEIADLLAYEITTAIIRPRFYIFSTDQLHQTKNHLKNADLWGFNIDRDLHLFLELTPNTTKLGNCLLENCDALQSYRKYQDNKPYEHSAVFEKLAEIIRVYGLPTTAAAVTTTSTTLPTAVTTTTAPSNFSTLSTVGASIIGSAASTMNAVVGSNVTEGISSPHPPQVLSHKKQNLIYVELLIKAHQCFVHECSMEGIANVLTRAKALNTVLTKAKSWSLIVRMLIGIARYREMYYCFDALIENEQFESLLGQFDEEKTIGLRQAILAYLREYEPMNSREFLKLAALHFLMYKDLAEMWEQDAQKLLSNILNSASMGQHVNEAPTVGAVMRLRCTNDAMNLMQQALQNYTHATENYLLDNKLLLAQKSASMAEVIAMQIDLMHKAGITGQTTMGNSIAAQHHSPSCVCVVNVQTREEFRELIKSKLSVPQALILSRGYGYDINWSEALLSQYVILLRKTYLSDFLALMTITDTIIENVVKGFQRYMQNNNKSTRQMEEHLFQLVTLVRSVTLKYKLASLLSMKSLVMATLNDQTVHYLKDTNYGRNENQNMPDI